MKKSLKFYALIWAVMILVFNLVVFLIRPVLPGYAIKYDARFWLVWGFIIAGFIVNIVCAYLALKESNLKKVFYNIPLITISRTALIVMFVVGCILILIPDCPAWIAAIVCIIVSAISLIAIIKAKWASDVVSDIDEKVKTQTSFIKNITVDAEGLVTRAKSDSVKAECKKVYEALRYSDPMSNDSLNVIEAKITVKMDEMSNAVNADEFEKAQEIADELVILVGDRNRKCKALK